MMKIPCIACKHGNKIIQGHRTFIECDDKERKTKGFYNDALFYYHKCSEQELKEECKKCKHLRGIYCENVYSECKFEPKEDE